MRSFPEVHGENCFLEILSRWITFTRDLDVSTPFLFLACGKLGFHYQSKQDSPTLVFPTVNLLQYGEMAGIRELIGVEEVTYESASGESWSELETALEQKRIPVIMGLSTLLPNEPQVLPTVTLLAVHQWDPSQRRVRVSNPLYNGWINLPKLQEIQQGIQEYGQEPHTWIEFRWIKEPKPEYRNDIIGRLRNSVVQEEIALQSEQNLQRFLADLKLLEQVTPVLKGLILKYLTKQMYHPWGPTATSLLSVQAMEELASHKIIRSETVSRFQEVHQEWKQVQLMFHKSSYSPSAEILERIMIRLNGILDMEQKAFHALKMQIGEGFHGEKVSISL
ncbi:hypothetical protein T458_00235 [Brevibacillus panacihumi W25]|uniref:Uncharacterized protein n=1 Tax=Brevibacillus panacihumi W25 TaxID=1408254 RepID=V6MMJ5_9BACL|nr:hypothetical protein T458_00235 [Brevibacillus panacihumi W25]